MNDHDTGFADEPDCREIDGGLALVRPLQAPGAAPTAEVRAPRSRAECTMRSGMDAARPPGPQLLHC